MAIWRDDYWGEGYEPTPQLPEAKLPEPEPDLSIWRPILIVVPWVISLTMLYLWWKG